MVTTCKETEYAYRCDNPAAPKGQGYCRTHATVRHIISPYEIPTPPRGSPGNPTSRECHARVFHRGRGLTPCQNPTVQEGYCYVHAVRRGLIDERCEADWDDMFIASNGYAYVRRHHCRKNASDGSPYCEEHQRFKPD